ncbi:MAG: ABC transporter permease subunit, partial [Wenzhouxiangellaceae bacterium]
MNSRFLPIARFEAWYQLRSPVFLVSYLLFFLLAFGGITSDNVQIGGVGNVNVNSPDAIAQNIQVFSFISMFVVIAFVANVVLRDVETRSAEMFFSTPVGKVDYLLGRFTGAMLVAVALLTAIPLGIMVGVQMPWLDPEQLGPFALMHYVHPFLVFGLVNLFFTGAVAFALATLTRGMALTYVVIVGYFLLTGVISTVSDVFESARWRDLLAMFDPFGGAAYGEVTRYWTAFERNEQIVPFSSLVMWNRLLWLGLGGLMLAATLHWFRFEVQPRGRKQRKAMREPEPEPVPAEAMRSVALPAVTRSHTMGTYWRQLLARSVFEARTVVFSVPFLVLVLLAVFITVINFLSLDQFYQTSVYPVTRLMTQIMQGTFTLSLLIVAVYYSGELVWREREARLHEVIDAVPTPGWVQAGAKMIAMLLILLTLLTIGIVTSMLFQLSQGYTQLQPGLYLTRYLLDYGLAFYVMAIFAVFVQTLTPNKYAGMGVMVLMIISLFVLDPLGFEDPLYQIGSAPGAAYSDMNGWGYFGWIQGWYTAYWFFVCVLLFVAAHLLWRRGSLERLRLRFRQAGANLTPGVGGLALAGVIGFCVTFGYIFYNTRILNEFITDDMLELRSVEYERRYRANEHLPQPRIVAVENQLDLYPAERRYSLEGRYVLENRTGEPVEQVFVGFNPAAEVREVLLDGSGAAESDREFQVYRFDLSQPMAPGQRLELTFSTERANRGFKHSRNAQPALGGGSATVIGNGSFVYGGDGMPYIGFSRAQILTNRNDRRKHDLPPIDRAPDLDDMEAARNSYLSRDSDWVDFRTIVSTEADQIAVAPGYPRREWEADGRRYFEYVMDAPMQNLAAWLSARYAVREEIV